MFSKFWLLKSRQMHKNIAQRLKKMSRETLANPILPLFGYAVPYTRGLLYNRCMSSTGSYSSFTIEVSLAIRGGLRSWGIFSRGYQNRHFRLKLMICSLLFVVFPVPVFPCPRITNFVHKFCTQFTGCGLWKPQIPSPRITRADCTIDLETQLS